MANEGERGEPDNHVEAPREGGGGRLIRYIERKFQERKTKKKNENAPDRAVRVTATATIWMAIFTFVLAFVGIVTLIEIIQGGSDTHDLAVAAGKQADRMKDFADRMKDQADRTKDLADRMKDQADRTKDLTNQTARLAKLTQDTLSVSQRAYVTIGRPDGTIAEILWPKDPKGNAGLLVYFQNNGRFPAKFNWGSDSMIIDIVPTDPNVFKEDEIAKGYVELPTNHLFQPMYRAKNMKGSNVGWSGTIDIAGGSTYQGILWELPKERMVQLLNLDRPLFPSGRFEYCDGFGRRVCKSFHLNYAKEPDARFWLAMEDECSAIDMQVLHPMPDYKYLPVCSTAERKELQTAIPSLPKPQ